MRWAMLLYPAAPALLWAVWEGVLPPAPREVAPLLVLAAGGIAAVAILRLLLFRPRRVAAEPGAADYTLARQVPRVAEGAADYAAPDRRGAFEADIGRIRALVARHEGPLLRHWRAGRRRTEWGTEDLSAWYAALEKFLAARGFRAEAAGRAEVEAIATAEVRVRAAALPAGRFRPAAEGGPADGAAFEDWVAHRLTELGWEAAQTPAGADQGVDVIAAKAGITIALQCKLHAAPVGNAAVQEIYAGAAHVGAEHAAVVAPSGFTRAAAALARSTGVLLLHPDDLTTVDPGRSP